MDYPSLVCSLVNNLVFFYDYLNLLIYHISLLRRHSNRHVVCPSLPDPFIKPLCVIYMHRHM